MKFEIVGNASALTEQQRQEITRMIGAHEIGAFHAECYWGDSSPAPSQTSAGGIPAQLCVGIYPACRPASAYIADMPSLALPGGPLGSIYYAEGGDWSAFSEASRA